MQEDEVIRWLVAWGEAQERVRAVLLTSTRARPGAALDPFSDYDVMLVVTDIHPFLEDERWLEAFGPVLVLYRDPVHVQHGHETLCRVTLYEDGTKIDYTVMPVAALQHVAALPELPPDLDVGYTVLLDRDSITAGLQPPTYTAYVPTPPGEEVYYQVVEEFFHESTYVAKNLWRDELLPWKYSLDQVMKTKKLRRMLEWHVEIEHDWSLKTGVLGKGLKKYVEPELWEKLECTYVGAGVEENWEALFGTIDLFRRVAIEVGERLGYDYPHDLDRRVVAYLRGVRAL